jgi:Fe2+ or Zn2+ uptake regulation protein
MSRKRMPVEDLILKILLDNKHTKLTTDQVFADISNRVTYSVNYETVKRTLNLLHENPTKPVDRVAPATYQYNTNGDVNIVFF